MEKKNYAEDIREIRQIMDRSSRFVSVSGLSGIFTGIIALAGTALAYRTIYQGQYSFYGYDRVALTGDTITQLLLIATGTLVLAIGANVFFTVREARRNEEKIWDLQTRRLLINLAIPLVTGGLLCLILLSRGYIGILAPLTLIFYGLALVNSSKYTVSEVRILGLIEILLGLAGVLFIGYGLWLWGLGFGLVHIVFGIVLQGKKLA